MRARTTVLAALATGAFVLVPAGAATAGSGPAPAPESHRSAPSEAPSAAGNPMSARAQEVGVCPDAHQIGSTAHITRKGETIASVKQFYSPDCNENYGYLWVWQSFRDKGGDWDVTTGIYSYSRDEVVGEASWTNSTGQEYWSNPADTAGECTAAVGSVRPSGDPLPSQAASPKRC